MNYQEATRAKILAHLAEVEGQIAGTSLIGANEETRTKLHELERDRADAKAALAYRWPRGDE